MSRDSKRDLMRCLFVRQPSILLNTSFSTLLAEVEDIVLADYLLVQFWGFLLTYALKYNMFQSLSVPLREAAGCIKLRHLIRLFYSDFHHTTV